MARVMLWVISRSKSTIILKILTNNSEVQGIFEPLTFAFFADFFGDGTLYNFKHLEEKVMKEPFTNNTIVWKDIPYFVENLDFKKWVHDKSFKHILLIRNPEDVAMSIIGYKG